MLSAAAAAVRQVSGGDAGNQLFWSRSRSQSPPSLPPTHGLHYTDVCAYGLS
ncbi:hypothetical protein J6590_083395 [Homalodisca vitripennis]|nr:hypothetical protein J6590_083395 [Homalodisca vitripennis]